MNENSPVQHQYCSAGEAHLLVCRDKKGHTVRGGKNFINQREAWIWTYLAEVLHPAAAPSQGQELRGATERRAVAATRESGATWQTHRERNIDKQLCLGLSLVRHKKRWLWHKKKKSVGQDVGFDSPRFCFFFCDATRCLSDYQTIWLLGCAFTFIADVSVEKPDWQLCLHWAT